MRNIIREQFRGFIHFVRTQGVVGFAVGFILGRAISDLVGSLVNDVINPIIGLGLSRFNDLGNLSLTIHGSEIRYGKTLSLLINFFILALVVYFVIKKAADVFDRPKDEPLPPSGKLAPKDVPPKDTKQA
ncbi:MAG TPA: MscL family protein [Candidatus Paceibacterota bacterium]|nr:MscL family protein [Candidatus Paceibacterota bacterium]